MPKGKPRRPRGEPLVGELNDIKRLLVLQLLASGVQATAIADALDVDKSVVSRMVPARKLRKQQARS